MGQRMFVALVPPDAVREDLSEFLAARPGMPWINPEQWHLTLAFCPDVPDHALDEVVDRLRRAVAGRPVGELALAGAGAFPHPDRAKVLWLGLVDARPDARSTEGAGGDPLEELRGTARAVRFAAVASGVVVDGRTFRPHLTLARLRRPVSATKWLRVLDGYRSPTWYPDEVVLVVSYLGQGPAGRPRYEEVGRFALGGSRGLDVGG